MDLYDLDMAQLAECIRSCLFLVVITFHGIPSGYILI
jgi:hypothetical protein